MQDDTGLVVIFGDIQHCLILINFLSNPNRVNAECHNQLIFIQYQLQPQLN